MTHAGETNTHPYPFETKYYIKCFNPDCGISYTQRALGWPPKDSHPSQCGACGSKMIGVYTEIVEKGGE